MPRGVNIKTGFFNAQFIHEILEFAVPVFFTLESVMLSG